MSRTLPLALIAFLVLPGSPLEAQDEKAAKKAPKTFTMKVTVKGMT